MAIMKMNVRMWTWVLVAELYILKAMIPDVSWESFVYQHIREDSVSFRKLLLYCGKSG